MKRSEKLKVVEDPSSELEVLLWSNTADYALLVYGKPERERRQGWWLFWRDASTHEVRSHCVSEAKSEREAVEAAARSYLDERLSD